MKPHPPLSNSGSPQAEVVLRAQQTERQRIAQLLHDTVSQSFNAVYLQAATLARKSQRNGAEGSEDLKRLADLLHQVVREMQTILRGLSAEEQMAPGVPQGTPATQNDGAECTHVSE